MDHKSIRVIDLTRLLPGPFATQLLADIGMDVVKIEDIERGDYARDIEPNPDTGVGSTFEAVNRGKRSIAINLKTDDGRQAFYDLVETADVIFEGFRPGVVDRLRIDYKTLTAYNEDIVYCSLSGYGQDSPLHHKPGHDLNYAALSGFLDHNRRDEDSPPQLPGFPLVDMGSGLFAAFNIVSALLESALGREGGEYIDIAMADVMTAFSQYYAGDVLRDENVGPSESRISGKYPCYDVYETADDRYVTIAALEPQFWEQFCMAIDREDLIDFHLSEDPAVREELREEVSAAFAAAPREEWSTRLNDVAAVMGVYTLSESLDHSHTSARDMVVDFEDWPSRLGFPAKTQGGLQIDGAIPGHGEQTRPLLKEVGYTDQEIDSLASAGILRTAE